MKAIRAIIRFYKRAGLWALWGIAHFAAGGIYVGAALIVAKFI